MNTRICAVLRADDDIESRAQLARHLQSVDQFVLVVFGSDRIPAEPWPELAHERVRVAFAPPARRPQSDQGSVSTIEARSALAAMPRKRISGVAHA
ncbi:MAG: hypothetical protein R3F18_16005 [Lysobacterales bacterium]|nr:hypothetical protein [Xanthomonadales bacterium]